ncbi:MAG: hypothetical protein RMJ17_02985 [Candidatus Aenigmarchaeota archaeon]|nr:hypothetical protein [Candidatus Aenigmarchaeota archaeon]MDW8149532.1 hypothetical protein [Candidatus Aenigmarchaeota archaeon]
MKGQFFVLTTVVIVFILFSISLYLQQFSTMDLASYLSIEEPVLMSNIVGKLYELNKSVETCSEFRYFSKDFLETVKKSYRNKLIKVDYYFSMAPVCNNFFTITIYSPRINISNSFYINRAA